MKNIAISRFKSFNAKTTLVFVLGMITGVFMVFQLAFRNNNDKKTGDKAVQQTPPQLYLPTVPDEISFAGEKCLYKDGK